MPRLMSCKLPKLTVLYRRRGGRGAQSIKTGQVVLQFICTKLHNMSPIMCQNGSGKIDCASVKNHHQLVSHSSIRFRRITKTQGFNGFLWAVHILGRRRKSLQSVAEAPFFKYKINASPAVLSYTFLCAGSKQYPSLVHYYTRHRWDILIAWRGTVD